MVSPCGHELAFQTEGSLGQGPSPDLSSAIKGLELPANATGWVKKEKHLIKVTGTPNRQRPLPV